MELAPEIIIPIIVVITSILIEIYYFKSGSEKTRALICREFCSNPHILLIVANISMVVLIGGLAMILILFLEEKIPPKEIGQTLTAIGILLTAIAVTYTTCPYYCPKQPTQQCSSIYRPGKADQNSQEKSPRLEKVRH